DVVEPIGEPQAAGAFEVLRHDGRIARGVLAEMARDGAGIEVIGAADAVADIELDVAAFVEVARCLSRGGGYGTGEDHGADAASPNFSTHKLLPGYPPDGLFLRRLVARRGLDLVEPVEAHLLDHPVAHHDQPRLGGRVVLVGGEGRDIDVIAALPL